MKQENFNEFQIAAIAAFQWFANHGIVCDLKYSSVYDNYVVIAYIAQGQNYPKCSFLSDSRILQEITNGTSGYTIHRFFIPKLSYQP